MSWFTKTAAKGENLHTPISRALDNPDAPFFGPLEDNDLFWTCAGGFVTETQVFYATLPDGRILMFQIIHSAVGLWSPNIQVTFGLFDTSANAKTKRIWKSVTVTHFTTAPANPKSDGSKLDKRSAKSDQFSVILDPATPDTYTIECKYDADVQLSMTVQRLPGVPGWKLGSGNRGGMSYFGNAKAPSNPNSKDPDTNGGSEGYVVHRFWPRCDMKGIARVGNDVVNIEGSRGTFIHAIQGMRPNLIASRWNFADFQSKAEDKTSLIMMEFTTTATHGNQKVNVGSVVVDDKLVAVTLGGSELPSGAKAEHQEVVLDKDTTYNAPGKIHYYWTGPAIDAASANVSATLDLQLAPAGAKSGSYQGTQGLIEKVDVMAEIPYIIKKVVNVVAGAKPYIYQWSNPAEATINLPAMNGQEARTLNVKGQLFNEVSFVSETP